MILDLFWVKKCHFTSFSAKFVSFLQNHPIHFCLSRGIIILARIPQISQQILGILKSPGVHFDIIKNRLYQRRRVPQNCEIKRRIRSQSFRQIRTVPRVIAKNIELHRSISWFCTCLSQHFVAHFQSRVSVTVGVL